MKDSISGEHLPLEIRTNRLLLKAWNLDDADDVPAYATDPEWARYLPPVPQPYEPHHAVEFLTAAIATDRAVNPIWAIEFEDHAIGGTNLRIGAEHARGETGYAIAREHWGKGFATEVFRTIVDNLASGRVMEKSGMARKATLRHFTVLRGKPTDVVLYRILRGEWAAGRAE